MQWGISMPYQVLINGQFVGIYSDVERDSLGRFMFCETSKDDALLKAHAETLEFKKYVVEIEAGGQMKLERFDL